MAWVALIVCGLVLWGSSAGVLAMGRDIWPGEIPDAVRLAVAPTIAAAVTLAQKIAAPDLDAWVRAVGLTLIVAALDALFLARLVDRRDGLAGDALGGWLPLAAIFAASLLVGLFAPK